jgi:hypothetical protein
MVKSSMNAEWDIFDLSCRQKLSAPMVGQPNSAGHGAFPGCISAAKTANKHLRTASEPKQSQCGTSTGVLNPKGMQNGTCCME